MSNIKDDGSVENEMRVGYVKSDGEKNFTFAVAQKIFTKENWDELEEYTSVVFDIQPILFFYEAMRCSFNDLMVFQEKFYEFSSTADQNFGRGHIHELMSLSAEGNQRVSNFLSSANSLLAYIETHLKKHFGTDSNEYRGWKSLSNDLHSDRISYRFLYELRNYSQHYSLPINGLSIRGDQLASNSPVFVSRLSISNQKLRDSGYKWNKVNSLSDLQAEIDILELISEHLQTLAQLSKRAIDAYQSRIIDCYQYVQTFLRVFNLPSDAIPVVFLGQNENSEMPPSEHRQFPADQFLWLMLRIKDIQETIEKDEGN